jgi:hypothetical protein
MGMSTGQNVLISGRIVWKSGDLFKGAPQLDFNTKQPKLDKTGKQVIQYGFGLAVSKQDPALNNFIGMMQTEARSVYQSGNVPPSFAYKYKDGDGIDDQGIPFSQREGYAGCIVFALTTQQPITWFKYDNGQNVLITEGVKCGDYVNVQVNMKANVPAVTTHKAGMFLNPNAVQLIGYGKEIVSNVINASSIFGNAAPVVPQGASAIPVAPQAGFFAPTPQPQAPQFQQPQMPPQPAQPHFGVLPQVHQPQAPQFQQPQMPQAPTGFGNPFGTQQ